MPVVETLAILGGVFGLGGGLAGIKWLRTPEITSDSSRLRWLDGTTWMLDEDNEAHLAFAELQAHMDREIRVSGGVELSEGDTALFAGVAPAEVLEEVNEDGKPSTRALSMHRDAVRDLAPMRGGVTGRPRRRRRATAFIRHWVARTRLHFPLRADRPSDRAAMAKWLGGEMLGYGMRATYVEPAVQLVLHLALLPSPGEVAGREAYEMHRPRTHGQRLLWSLKKWTDGLLASSISNVSLGEFEY